MNRPGKLKRTVCFALLAVGANVARADVVVVVSAKSTTTTMTPDEDSRSIWASPNQ
jgi:hypothetical protein